MHRCEFQGTRIADKRLAIFVFVNINWQTMLYFGQVAVFFVAYITAVVAYITLRGNICSQVRFWILMDITP